MDETDRLRSKLMAEKQAHRYWHRIACVSLALNSFILMPIAIAVIQALIERAQR